jgi:uncharacterized surface protein with fasciclin (FAS1) repeats
MLKQALPLCVGAMLGLAACDQGAGGADNGAASTQPDSAQEAAGNKTIAAGIDQNGGFFRAAKSVGLDATLAGPGPYTVFIPDDQALTSLEGGGESDNRARLTGVLTNHILPGTILAEDISKAIDNGNHGGRHIDRHPRRRLHRPHRWRRGQGHSQQGRRAV